MPTLRSVLSVPLSARVACWLNAWLQSRESADATISGVDGCLGGGEFALLSDGGTLSTALFLGELRRRGVRRASSALPVPGDPLGLGGPAAFNAEVLEVGEGVLLHGAELGLIPRRLDGRVRWRVGTARPPSYLPTVAEADRELRATLLRTANRLATLDVASWRPEVADLLTTLRHPARDDADVPFASAESARLASDALRAVEVVAVARADDGGAVSAFEASSRADALRPLDSAARAALVAATSSVDGR